MIIRKEDIQSVCNDILTAVDSSELSVLTETLELAVEDAVLNLSVTNREYYTRIKLPLSENVDFRATVNANLFLKLISQITTDTIEFNVDGNALVVKGNGTYKLPLIFDNEKLLELPVINIDNVTTEFDIDSNILQSILKYNSKVISATGNISSPVQKMYYLDNKGAITITACACVNQFTLPEPIKILLTQRIVKLFKLFRGGSVHFTMGYDPVTDAAEGGICRPKVRFESNNVSISAVLPYDDGMISSVPATAVRELVEASYPYSVTLNKDALLEAISRMLLFRTSTAVTAASTFEFHPNEVIVYDGRKENKETLYYNNDTSNVTEPYVAILDLNDLKATLETCSEQYINIQFGQKPHVLLRRGNITTVIVEIGIE